MSEREYAPNSHKYREEQKEKAVVEKRVEKVVSGTAKTKKKSGVARFIGKIFLKTFSIIFELFFLYSLVTRIKHNECAF
jgi:hypothetical protein